MANILKVTTPPSTTYNNTIKGNQNVSQTPQIKNEVNLNRITPRDQSEGGQSLGKNAMHYDSNYNKFLENVQNNIPMSDIMREIFGSSFETLVGGSATSPSMAKDLMEFIEMIKMDEGELAKFAKNQIDNAVGFKSAFFEMLRDMMNHTESIDFKADILKFAKRYNDMASNQRILGEIAHTLQELSKAIPRSEGVPLAQMSDALNLEAKNGDTAVNLQLLKNEILPLLSKYISRTNDLGKVRDLMSLLSLNISRYESGTKEDVLSALKTLTQYEGFQSRLGGPSDEKIALLLDKMMTDKQNEQNPFVDKLATIIDKGLKGQVGYESRMAFENMARSILVNESVYMPLIYTILPAEIAGKQLFSEMWIDPDDGNHSLYREEDRVNRVYLRFNVEGLGNFDMIMNMQHGKVDLQLLCPDGMDKDFREIKKDISQIIEKNNLKQNNIYVEKGTEKINLIDVFPKIKEGRNAINVTI